ncbi:Charged multivesicular body protein 2b [Armadillidium nasatum]|uniref:Charged multivesicular body protein 2b n=1 Tax=Armadillidium nasatum TaxID=96803 RepID=A0A5N5T279_9CRUS|nr:Charged multivesicular body protein 2b [Armadillidium nasatum]
MSLFKKKPTMKEQMRANERDLRKVGRDVERDRRELEREEKKLEMEIKKLAKSPANKEALRVLAKQLVQIRKQKNRTYAANSRITSVASQQKVMHANVKLSDAMGATAKTMGNMNKIMNPAQVAQTMQEFEKASTKLDMSEEVINDTLDDIMNESGDEEESDAIVNQVLDEIGIEIGSKVAGAPAARSDSLATTVRSPMTDEELEESLAKLRAN